MKSILRLAILLIGPALLTATSAQSQILKKIKQRASETAEQRVLERTGEATEKSMDEVEKGAKKKNKNRKEGEEESIQEEEQASTQQSKSPAKEFRAYSKFDFIPGEKTIFFEDFASDAIGDFPARWNTNQSGEVMTANNVPGKWFRLKEGGSFVPDDITNLPESFTIEFDLIISNLSQFSGYGINIDIYGGETSNSLGETYPGENGIRLYVGTNGHRVENVVDDQIGPINSDAYDETIVNNHGKPQRISIWRQGQRFRFYLNEKKVFDLPRAFGKNVALNLLRFNTSGTIEEEGLLLVSNIRVAIGAPDTRSKLLTEGKLVTQGILFDVNSDKIKPQSAGTLKSIADVLKENSSLKVRIVGHTDSDGDEASNLALSRKRAASVKKALSDEYGINASRMETDGEGEANPIADNKTAEGKANNRRVEFLRQ